MPDVICIRFVNEVLADPAVCGHLTRAVRGEGRCFPVSDGSRRFACDTAAWSVGDALDAG